MKIYYTSLEFAIKIFFHKIYFCSNEFLQYIFNLLNRFNLFKSFAIKTILIMLFIKTRKNLLFMNYSEILMNLTLFVSFITEHNTSFTAISRLINNFYEIDNMKTKCLYLIELLLLGPLPRADRMCRGKPG